MGLPNPWLTLAPLPEPAFHLPPGALSFLDLQAPVKYEISNRR